MSASTLEMDALFTPPEEAIMCKALPWTTGILERTLRGPKHIFRGHLKKIFLPYIGVEPSTQILDILEYACGLRFGLALISNKNPDFEIASNKIV